MSGAKDDKEVSFAVVFQILSHMEVSAHACFEHRYTNQCLRIAEQRKRGADVVRPHFWSAPALSAPRERRLQSSVGTLVDDGALKLSKRATDV
jgi:hypothetical protein